MGRSKSGVSVGNAVGVSLGREASVGAVVTEGIGDTVEMGIGDSVAMGLVQETMRVRNKKENMRSETNLCECERMKVFYRLSRN
jgi:hypothetical protein